MTTTDPDGLDCSHCPARRFPSQSALTEHIEHDCSVYAAELAARPVDPLTMLREALVWAIDEGALRLIPEEFQPLLDPTQLKLVKSPPGFAACLVGKCGGVEVRARLTTGGRELHLQVDIPPWASQRTRLHLPAQFAVARVNDIPTREAA